MIFSDESTFPIERYDKRKYVYRRVNERYADPCVQRVEDKRSVMVWGAISIRGKGELIINRGNIDAPAYQDQILTPDLLPLLQNHLDVDRCVFNMTAPRPTRPGPPGSLFVATM